MTKRLPPIQCLQTFELLARLRNVTRTAGALCVTPSAVSSRIKQLEEIAGVPLFLHADFSLTPAGQECLKDVRDVLQVLEKRFNNPKPTRFTSPFDIRFIARVNRIGNVLSASSLLSSGEA